MATTSPPRPSCRRSRPRSRRRSNVRWISSPRCRSGRRGVATPGSMRSSTRPGRRTTERSRSRRGSPATRLQPAPVAPRRTPSNRRHDPPCWSSGHERSRQLRRRTEAPVYLKSVSVKGFKSFPDRTRLEFGPGVSVIVGPNGSGKSNVTDAVLWALGEQSPVAVRGQSMQDVIFGGAPGRKAASTAEVELVLDDSEQALGLGVSEISIVRRLDRSGEGEYRLAGARCRLIDVLELLSDTGLGKEMHSVISQGRVESLVTSKPRERRLLIEEAAGLGKHRKRRRRAQLKLERTHDNLDRALDVEREARSRLRPLKRQAEAAELHERLHRQTLEVGWELARDDLRARTAEVAQAAARVRRSSASSSRWPSDAGSPRRRWRPGPPSARSSRAAATPLKRPVSGSA